MHEQAPGRYGIAAVGAAAAGRMEGTEPASLRCAKNRTDLCGAQQARAELMVGRRGKPGFEVGQLRGGFRQVQAAALREAQILAEFRGEATPYLHAVNHQGQLARVASLLAYPAPVAP